MHFSVTPFSLHSTDLFRVTRDIGPGTRQENLGVNCLRQGSNVFNVVCLSVCL